MKILYISTVFPRVGTSTIYTDLAERLVESGHRVIVVTTEERKSGNATGVYDERGCKVLRVKTGNMYDVGLLEKGISTITLSLFIKRAIRRYLSVEKIDLILFEAPPVTLAAIVKYAKKKFDAKAFLMMKDIFPQNAVDIGIIKKNSIIYKYFSYKEAVLYQVADKIGCMSIGNVNYLKENQNVASEKLSVFPNTKKIVSITTDKSEIRRKYNIPEDKVVFIFGGNMGKPQGMEFLATAVRAASVVEEAFFVLVGRGTEREGVQIALKGTKNSIVLDNLPREEYEKLVYSCDVGIISLDSRFTIPNYPSRVLSYMEYSMPVLATTDKNTDFKELIIEQALCGMWCESKSTDKFIEIVRRFVSCPEAREKMGKSGRKYLEKYFNVEKSVKLLEEYYTTIK